METKCWRVKALVLVPKFWEYPVGCSQPDVVSWVRFLACEVTCFFGSWTHVESSEEVFSQNGGT